MRRNDIRRQIHNKISAFNETKEEAKEILTQKDSQKSITAAEEGVHSTFICKNKFKTKPYSVLKYFFSLKNKNNCDGSDAFPRTESVVQRRS